MTQFSKGGEVFTKLFFGNNKMDSKKLETLLKRSHHAGDERITKLIHPTVATKAAFDILHDTASTDWSPYSFIVRKLLHQLYDAFTIYVVADILYTIMTHIKGGPNDIILEIHKSFKRDHKGVPTEEVNNKEGYNVNKEKYYDDRMQVFLKKIIGTTRAVERAGKIARKFVEIVKLDMVFGVVPVFIETIKTQGNKRLNSHDLCSSSSDEDDSQVSRLVEAYLKGLEIGANKIRVPHSTSITNNLILTKQYIFQTSNTSPLFFGDEDRDDISLISTDCNRGGTKFTCTDFLGSLNYEFLRFSTANDDWDGVGSIVEMVGHEFHYTYLQRKIRERAVDQVTKTQIVVSSEVSEEVTKLVSKQISSKPPDAFSALKDVMETLEQDSKKFTKDVSGWKNTKALDEMFARNEEGGVRNSTIADLDTMIDEMKYKELTGLMNTRKSVHDKYKRLDVDQSEVDEITNFEIFGEGGSIGTGGINSTSATSYIPRPTTSSTIPISSLMAPEGDRLINKQSKQVGLSRQDEYMQKALKSLKTTNISLVHRNKIQSSEIMNLAEKAAVQKRYITKQHSAHVVLLGEQVNWGKREKALVEEVEVINERVSKCQNLLSRLTDTLTLSEEERKKFQYIMTGIGGGGGGNNEQYGDGKVGEFSERELQDVVETLTRLISGGGVKEGDDVLKITGMYKEKERIESKRLRSHLAYERMLTRNNIRAIPVFSSVWKQIDLNRVNNWFQEPWMRDGVIMDKFTICDSAYDNEMEYALAVQNNNYTQGKGSHGDGLNKYIFEDENMHIINVNPKTKGDANNIRKFMETQRLTNDEGAELLKDNIYTNRCINIKFPTTGEMESTIHDPLRQRWDELAKNFFSLGDPLYTKQGQLIPHKINELTIEKFVTPFITLCIGNRENTFQVIPAIIHSLFDPVELGQLESFSITSKWNRLLEMVSEEYLRDVFIT